MSEFLTDEEIEAAAAELRADMGLSGDGPLTWEDLTKNMERALPGVRLLVIPDEEMSYAVAEADPDQRRIRMRATAFGQLKNNSEWALEVLAHELGHLKLDHAGVRMRRAGLNHAGKIRRDEPQAHLFARALLAPAGGAANLCSASELASKYRLTTRSAETRFEIVQRLRRRQTGSKRELPQFVVDFLKEAEARGYKVKTDLNGN